MTRLALHSNTAMMPLDQRPTEREAESQTEIQFMLDGAPFSPIETTPEAPPLFGRDAWFFTMDLDTCHLVLLMKD